MDLSFTDEQEMLRDALARFLDDRFDFATRRARRADPGLWRALNDELGVIGASLPERAGGLGGGAVEAMIVAEAFGRSLVHEPWLERVVLAGTLLDRVGGDEADALLAGIAGGDALVAVGLYEAATRYRLDRPATRAVRDGNGWRLSGAKPVIVGAPGATHLLVSAATDAGVSLFLVEPAAAGATLHPFRLIDDRAAADLVLDGAPATLFGAEGGALPAIEAAVDAATAALCAEAAGLGRRMLDDTLAYTRERRQFGQPIASFQALQHRMVDMFIACERMTSAAYLAALSQEASPSARGRAVSAAKATVADAIRFVAQNAAQLHGAMGITEELAVGHYFKRATVIEQQFGSADHHRRRYAAAWREEALAA